MSDPLWIIACPSDIRCVDQLRRPKPTEREAEPDSETDQEEKRLERSEHAVFGRVGVHAVDHVPTDRTNSLDDPDDRAPTPRSRHDQGPHQVPEVDDEDDDPDREDDRLPDDHVSGNGVSEGPAPPFGRPSPGSPCQRS